MLQSVSAVDAGREAGTGVLNEVKVGARWRRGPASRLPARSDSGTGWSEGAPQLRLARSVGPWPGDAPLSRDVSLRAVPRVLQKGHPQLRGLTHSAGICQAYCEKANKIRSETLHQGDIRAVIRPQPRLSCPRPGLATWLLPFRDRAHLSTFSICPGPQLVHWPRGWSRIRPLLSCLSIIVIMT
ncbi:hypothetical protein mRhiFer1_009625 [Rhinolophus ferrumequinum]|uniref:Uncharacterized protein n=1 Tax=Rhinolophus ferrumequinum TaxID=59479 RepID=A0A7J7ZQI1_RHIFE|nr:hypothetical protein mRhiFer1_009625 [Rhinolophus ferrumequinum]